MKRTILVLVAVLSGLALLAGSVSASYQTASTNQQDSSSFEQGEPPEQPAAAATAVAVAGGLSALGSVEANRVASLQFQTGGTVKEVYAAVGDYIQAGEVVADLEDNEAWRAYDEAELNLESAQLSLAEVNQPPSEDDLRVARANLASAQAAYTSAVNPVSNDQLSAAQLNYDNAVLQQQALESARRNMNGSDSEIAQAEAQIGAASFNAEIARLQLEKLKTTDNTSAWSASIRIKQAELALQQLQEGPTQSEITSAQIAVDRALATVKSAQIALQHTQLIAPISGYITAVSISSGQSVTSGTAAIEISDMSRLRMTVPINELDISHVTEGMSTTIQLDALADVEIQGTVEHVGWIASTSSDGIVTYDVTVVLNTDDARARIGMTGEVTIQTGSANT